MIMKGVLQDKN